MHTYLRYRGSQFRRVDRRVVSLDRFRIIDNELQAERMCRARRQRPMTKAEFRERACRERGL